MLFEINENPKIIQQLLDHKDVKKTLEVYNNVLEQPKEFLDIVVFYDKI